MAKYKRRPPVELAVLRHLNAAWQLIKDKPIGKLSEVELNLYFAWIELHRKETK